MGALLALNATHPAHAQGCRESSLSISLAAKGQPWHVKLYSALDNVGRMRVCHGLGLRGKVPTLPAFTLAGKNGMR